MTSTVQASVEPINLLRNIESTFTGNLTFIGELLQNARRAGATSIYVDSEINDEHLTLVFSDDGRGLSNFNDLVALGKSGWDAGIVSQDSPFGMGFYSVLFAGDVVNVESGTSSVSITREDVLEMRPIALTTNETAFEGTRVTIQGSKKELVKAFKDETKLAQIVAGFPVPVFFNGQPLLATRGEAALKDNILVDSEHGRVYKNWANSCARLFLQGLSVDSGSYLERGLVFHLTSSSFNVRMPDRDRLLETDENKKRLQKLNDLACKAMIEEARLKGDWVWLWDNYSLVRSFDCLEVFNECDYLPADKLVDCRSDCFIDGEALCSDEWEMEIEREIGEIKEADIEDRFVISANDLDSEFLKRQYVAAIGAFALNCDLDDGHWVTGYFKDFRADVEYSAEPVGLDDRSVPLQGYHVGCCGYVYMQECESVMLKGSHGDAVVEDIGILFADNIYVPKKTTGVTPSCYLDFYDEYGSLRSEDFDRANDELERALKALRNNPKELLLESITSIVRGYSGLGLDGRYQLSIVDGVVTLDAA